MDWVANLRNQIFVGLGQAAMRGPLPSFFVQVMQWFGGGLEGGGGAGSDREILMYKASVYVCIYTSVYSIIYICISCACVCVYVGEYPRSGLW